MPKEKRHWWIVFSIALILPRLVTLWIPIFNIDEAVYAIFGQEILHGALPFQDFVDRKPPLIYYFYAFFFWLGGQGNMILVHVAHLVVVALVCWVLFQIGTILANRKVGRWAALFYAIFSAAFVSDEVLATNAEALMVLPLSLAVLLLFKSDQNFSWWKDFLGGLCLGIAFLTKYPAGINLFLTILYLGILGLLFFPKESSSWMGDKKRKISHFFHRSLLYGLGFVFPILFFLFYFWIKGGLDEMYYWGWKSNFTYISQGKQLLTWDYFLLKGFYRIFLFALGGFLIWFLGIKQIYKSLCSFRRGFINKENTLVEYHLLFCILWFLLSLIPVSLGGRFFFHYFIQFIPPLCLLASLSASHLWDMKKHRLALVFFSTLPFLIFMPESTSLLWDKKKNQEIVADYIKSNSDSNDQIFIWGFIPKVYYLSRRRPASRFIHTQFLTGFTPKTDGMDFDPKKPNEIPNAFRRILMDLKAIDPPTQDYDTSDFIDPKSWEQLADDLKKNQPLYILDATPSNIREQRKYPIHRYPYLKNFIEENYQFEKNIAEIYIYRRKVLSHEK